MILVILSITAVIVTVAVLIGKALKRIRERTEASNKLMETYLKQIYGKDKEDNSEGSN